MGNFLFVVQIAVVVSGLAMMCAALFQIKRQGGFQQAMALTSEGKWPICRLLFIGAVLCFGLAMFIWCGSAVYEAL